MATSARLLGLTSCHVCRLLISLPSAKAAHCPRCRTAVFARIPASLSITWALLLAATILYIPANVLPISTVVRLGATESSTILGGVIFFVQHGEWPIALIIFAASVVVPVCKIAVLGYLLLSVQFAARHRRRERTRLYRIIEAVGRWSMVDIFVVTVMATLFHIGTIASFEVGPAAVFFAAVVVLTMIAVMTFDPRLIWDAGE